MEDVDRYHTLSKPSLEFVCKEKGSKFVGYAFPVSSETAIKDSIAAVKKIHPKSRHICFAWKLGVESVVFRTNDDGEPNNSAPTNLWTNFVCKLDECLGACSALFWRCQTRCRRIDPRLQKNSTRYPSKFSNLRALSRRDFGGCF